ncbi:MAG: hypothetical protein PHD48_08815 [Alphaproteobacteria bacterium]|nr:hypothetical protein [Alphaproteobacteria bacterium]
MLECSVREFQDRSCDEQHFIAKLFVWAVVFAASLCPGFAYATEVAGTLGAIMCNARSESSRFPELLNALSFVSGAIICVRGVLLFRKHADNPNDSQMTKAIWHLVVAAALMSLPVFAGVIQRTIFGTISGGSTWECTPGGTNLDGTAGLDVMMQNFVKNIHAPMMILVSYISILVGLVYIVRALYKAAKTGSGAQGSDPKSIITHLVIGAILISTGTSFSDVMKSLFGDNTVTDMFTYNGIAWSKLTGSEDVANGAKNTVNAVLAFVQIIGIIAFVRGWLVLKAALDGGQATVPQGLIFVISGVMAVNIGRMIEIFNATFGTNIIN